MKFQNMNFKNLLKAVSAICLAMLLSININAQDKTAAGVYNDGLAKLKAKDYVAGLPLMEEALTLAEAEENEQVIGLAKKNGSVAAYNIGNTKRKEKLYDEALVLFERGIELNPEYASNFFGKAQVLEAKDMAAEALVAHLVAANKYIESGKQKRGDKIINKAKNDVGRAYVAKDYDLAIEMGSAFLENASNPEVHYYLAQSYGEKGDHENSLAQADLAIETAMAEEGTEAKDKYFYVKGSALENLGRNAEAVEAFKKITGEKYKQQAEYKIQKLGK